MAVLRLGQLEFLNCLPVYHALEEKQLDFDGNITSGPPNLLNGLLAEEKLDVTPISSIEYARNYEKYLILPDLCIGSDGRVASVLLLSKKPVTELDGGRIAVTKATATSVVLLQILLEHYYQVQARFYPLEQKPEAALQDHEGLLLIGDEALHAHRKIKEENLAIIVTDLGDIWKRFTGEAMVYAVWAVRESVALQDPEKVESLNKLLLHSKEWGKSNLDTVVRKAQKKTGLPIPVLEDYFRVIDYDFGQKVRKSLCVFYDYAYKSGIIKERVSLRIWGQKDEKC